MSRVSLPVSVDVPGERLPAGVEATAYFVVSEALTNVVEHARAAGARVPARVERGELGVEIRDLLPMLDPASALPLTEGSDDPTPG